MSAVGQQQSGRTAVRASAGPCRRVQASVSAPSTSKFYGERAAFKPSQASRRVQRLQASRLQGTRTVVTAAAAKPLRVMIAGAPAAGKGTQCAKIVEKYGLVHISVGDLLRAEVAAGTAAGVKAKAFMDNGDLVPNEVVVEMVKGQLEQGPATTQGWLLDGYPRSGEQADAIEAVGIRPDLFLLINVPDDLLVERVVGRRSDPATGEIYHLTFKPPPAEAVPRLVQRSDDTEDKVRNRLATYHKNVDAVLGYYTGQLVEIDGNQSMEEVFSAIDVAIDAARAMAHASS